MERQDLFIHNRYIREIMAYYYSGLKYFSIPINEEQRNSSILYILYYKEIEGSIWQVLLDYYGKSVRVKTSLLSIGKYPCKINKDCVYIYISGCKLDLPSDNTNIHVRKIVTDSSFVWEVCFLFSDALFEYLQGVSCIKN